MEGCGASIEVVKPDRQANSLVAEHIGPLNDWCELLHHRRAFNFTDQIRRLGILIVLLHGVL